LCALASVIHSNFIDILCALWQEVLLLWNIKLAACSLYSDPSKYSTVLCILLTAAHFCYHIHFIIILLSARGCAKLFFKPEFCIRLFSACVPYGCLICLIVRLLNNIRRGIQIVKCLFMQFLPLLIYFICVKLNYFLQLVVLTYLQYVLYCFLLRSVGRASRYICVIKTNLMRYLSSVYFVNQPLHVSGIFAAHHQEVYCIYKVLRYKSEGHWFDPGWCHEFFIDINSSDRSIALRSTQPLTEMSTGSISWG
jgi:hypothetical protein